MKLLNVLVLCAASAVLTAAEIASWDFTKGINSTDGKFVFKPQVAALVKAADDKSGMEFTAPEGDKTSGLRSSKIYGALTPQGAFEIELTFKPDLTKYAPNTKRKTSVLWDNKYYYSGKARRQNCGFQVRATISGKSMFVNFYYGLGDRTMSSTSRSIKLEDGKFYTIRISYDPAGKVAFSWNGAKPYVFVVKNGAGNVAPAMLPVTIGNRHSSTHMPFAGVISKVVLSSVDAPNAQK